MYEIAGRIYGRLIAVRRSDRQTQTKRGTARLHYWCKCQCGTEKEVLSHMIKSGKVVSCGCYRKEKCAEQGKKKFIHGHRRQTTPEYWSWKSMRYRCKKYTNFKNKRDYYGRGIRVCPEWDHAGGFVQFLKDMGLKPGPKYSLDRIDNNGNYEPSNCRWTTQSEQTKNRRKFKAIGNFSDEEILEEAKKRGLI